MKKLGEDAALAILFANTKRKKRKEDLVTIAKSCAYLVDLYKSRRAVAEKIGLSTEMIRQFLAVLKLPKEVQRLFAKRKIDSFDAAKELAALKDPKLQLIASKAIADSLTKDVRDIKRLIKEARVSVAEAKKVVSDAKPEELHIFVMDCDEQMYNAIMKHATARGKEPLELVKEIVAGWLKEKSRIRKR